MDAGKITKTVITGAGGAAVVCACAVALSAGCGGITSTYEQRAEYLQKTAQRGAAMHDALVAQEAMVDKPRCMRAYEGSQVEVDAPGSGSGFNADDDAWKGQIKEVYVDSCVSGKPRPDGVTPSVSPSASPSGSPSPSAR